MIKNKPSEACLKYKAFQEQLFEIRELNGQQYTIEEDNLLYDMDLLWFRMTEEEKDEINALVK